MRAPKRGRVSWCCSTAVLLHWVVGVHGSPSLVWTVMPRVFDCSTDRTVEVTITTRGAGGQRLLEDMDYGTVTFQGALPVPGQTKVLPGREGDDPDGILMRFDRQDMEGFCGVGGGVSSLRGSPIVWRDVQAGYVTRGREPRAGRVRTQVRDVVFHAAGADDPDEGHRMTGLNGQSFSFDGEAGEWYALLAQPSLQVNMRVDAAYSPSLRGHRPRTRITGIGVLGMGWDGILHSVTVTESTSPPPDSQASGDEAAPPPCGDDGSQDQAWAWGGGAPPCLSGGGVRVLGDGEDISRAGDTILSHDGSGVSLAAVNIPPACRGAFGLEDAAASATAEMLTEMSWGTDGGSGSSDAPTTGMVERMRRRGLPAQRAGSWAEDEEECRAFVAGAYDSVSALWGRHSDHSAVRVEFPTLSLLITHHGWAGGGGGGGGDRGGPGGVAAAAVATRRQGWRRVPPNAPLLDIAFEFFEPSVDRVEGIMGETAHAARQRGGGGGSGAGGGGASSAEEFRLAGDEAAYKVDGPMGREFEQLFVQVQESP